MPAVASSDERRSAAPEALDLGEGFGETALGLDELKPQWAVSENEVLARLHRMSSSGFVEEVEPLRFTITHAGLAAADQNESATRQREHQKHCPTHGHPKASEQQRPSEALAKFTASDHSSARGSRNAFR